MESGKKKKSHRAVRSTFLIPAIFLVLMIFLKEGCLWAAPEPNDQETTISPSFEAFSFDRPQYYYNVNGHNYTPEEIDTIVYGFYEAGFAGIMLEFEWEYNKDYQGLGRGWYGPTNGDSVLNQYFKDDKVAEYFISAARRYGLRVSIIISSLNDRIGTNKDGHTDPFDTIYTWWIYPNEKAFDLFKRKVDIIAPLDVDEIVIDFARTPYPATTYTDTVNAILDLTDNEIDYIKSNYPQLEVAVAVNSTYQAGLSQNADRIKTHGGKVLRWENHDINYTLGVESGDEGYFIYPVKPTFWWDIGRWTSVDLAEVLVYGTEASPAVIFLHTPLSHDDYLNYSIQGVIGPALGNHCPILDQIDDLVVKESDLITIVASAADIDNDSLTYYISDPRFEQNYNMFTWQTQVGDRGKHHVLISVRDGYCGDSQILKINITLSLGDINNDGEISVVDIVYLISYLFNSGSAPVCKPATACADVNLDGEVTMVDVIYLISYLFRNGSIL